MIDRHDAATRRLARVRADIALLLKQGTIDAERASELSGFFRGVLLDEEWYDEEHRRAVARIHDMFKPWTVYASTMLGGLARVYTRYAAREMFDTDSPLAILRPSTPWGWRWRKDHNRAARVLMPLWLYWLVAAWDARWLVFPAMKRLGLWQTFEGHEWMEGRFTAPRWLRALVWCFLHDEDFYWEWPRRRR